MACFEVTLADRTVEQVAGADAYEMEGPMTTFFNSSSAKGSLDSWSTRLASFRSADVLIIRRVVDPEHTEDTAHQPRLEIVAAQA